MTERLRAHLPDVSSAINWAEVWPYFQVEGSLQCAIRFVMSLFFKKKMVLQTCRGLEHTVRIPLRKIVILSDDPPLRLCEDCQTHNVAFIPRSNNCSNGLRPAAATP